MAIGNRIVVFLGAGASKPLGFPLTKDILPEIWAALNRQRGRHWKHWAGMKSRRQAARLRAFFGILLPGLDEAKESFEGTSIVDVISLLDQLIAEGRSPSPGFGEDDLLDARLLLNMGINGVLQGRSKPSVKRTLADWMISTAISTRDARATLISTNYDTAFEQPLYDRLIKRGVSVGQTIDFGMPWRDAYRNLFHVRPRDARLAVFKLHGSLNWLRCETCGHMRVNVRKRIAYLEFWRPVWKPITTYITCNCGGRLRSVIVTPSVVRDVREGNLLSIWNAALEDLRLADEWILIGYSLPPEDIAIRSLILRAFHARRRKRLRVRVVQYETNGDGPPSPEFSRYRLFFPDRHLRDEDYVRGGVEQFTRGLPPPPRNLDALIMKTFPRPARYLRRERMRA